jgi:hypothetical protein
VQVYIAERVWFDLRCVLHQALLDWEATLLVQAALLVQVTSLVCMGPGAAGAEFKWWS